MNTRILELLFFTYVIVLLGCTQSGLAQEQEGTNARTIDLRFLSEFILPPNPYFEGTTVGGLSSIDYHNGNYYLVCDDEKNPRFYTMKCELSNEKLVNVVVTSVTELHGANEKKSENKVDPEALRFDKDNGLFYWCSEGKIKKEEPPTVNECDQNGKMLRSLTLPAWKTNKKNLGPRHNMSLESLAISNDGDHLWVAQEVPLKQDGKKPTHKSNLYPIRFSKINKDDFTLNSEFVYPLDPVARESVKKGGTAINGLAEVLCYDDNSFLTIERSYVSGYDDGGNDVKIYQAFIDEASDVSDLQSLKNESYQTMRKELVVDFNEIKKLFPHGFIDNIEGICIGPTLANGNRTVFVVSDDNFGKYGPQANQFILFELTVK